MSKRLYRVEFSGKVFLVDASSQSQAMNHVIKKQASIIVEVATTKQVASLITGGVTIETAGDEVVEAEKVNA